MVQPFEGISFKNRQRLLGRLDRMVASGQVTDVEAGQLRAAEDEAQFQAAVTAIRSRHAGTRLAAAVTAGEMSQSEADANLDRIRRGEHPRGLRAHLGRLSRRRDGQR